MKPFPWKCRTCGNRSVNSATIDYVAEKEHDGRAYSLSIPNLAVFLCDECHARILPDESRAKVDDALRAAAGLLTPKEMRENRKRLGLTQDQLGKLLKVAKETVSRWETGGQIQQRAMDLLLRVFYGVPEARAYMGLNVATTAKPICYLAVTQGAIIRAIPEPLEQPRIVRAGEGDERIQAIAGISQPLAQRMTSSVC